MLACGWGYGRFPLSRLCFEKVENKNASKGKGDPSHARPQHRLVSKSELKWSTDMRAGSRRPSVG